MSEEFPVEKKHSGTRGQQTIHFHPKHGTIYQIHLCSSQGGRNMKNWKKKLTAAMLAAVCLTGAAAPVTVEAATTTQKILYGAAALLFISSYYTSNAFY